MRELIAETVRAARHELGRLADARRRLQEELGRVDATIHFRNGQIAALETLQAKADTNAAPPAPSDNR